MSEPSATAPSSEPVTAPPALRKGSLFVLFMLILVYTLNFLDRQIISILKDPIATELKLDDAQLGLMGGLAFAVLYSNPSHTRGLVGRSGVARVDYHHLCVRFGQVLRRFAAWPPIFINCF